MTQTLLLADCRLLKSHAIDELIDLVVSQVLPRRCAHYAAHHPFIAATLRSTQASKACTTLAVLFVPEG